MAVAADVDVIAVVDVVVGDYDFVVGDDVGVDVDVDVGLAVVSVVVLVLMLLLVGGCWLFVLG